MIAFIGSVFSPYYAWAQRRSGQAGADPLNHCALNVALYGPSHQRWAMTERGRSELHRDSSSLRIGPSALRWHGDTLTIEIDEVAAPFPARIRGVVSVHAPHRFACPVALAPHHYWHPIAPSARVEVDVGGLRWSGSGYLDSNRGDAPAIEAFRGWSWSRAQLPGDRCVVFYDIERIGADALQIGLQFGARGRVETVALPPKAALPSTLWRIPRIARSDAGSSAKVVRTLTDAPFYARSLLSTQVNGERVSALHESLSLSRFASTWVQAMLPFRMPRSLGWGSRRIAPGR